MKNRKILTLPGQPPMGDAGGHVTRKIESSRALKASSPSSTITNCSNMFYYDMHCLAGKGTSGQAYILIYERLARGSCQSSYGFH